MLADEPTGAFDHGHAHDVALALRDGVASTGGALAIPGNVADLRPLHDAGSSGASASWPTPGVEEFPRLEPAEFVAALRAIAEFDGLMIVHAEDTHALEHAPGAAGRGYGGFLASRPRGAESLAIAEAIEAARWTGSGCTSCTFPPPTRCR